MPIYEYECPACEERVEDIASLDDCDKERYCMACSRLMVKVLSVPVVRMGKERPSLGNWRSSQVSNGSSTAIHTWDPDRKFPNLRQGGDGAMSFPTKSAYEGYLKSENIHETSTNARKVKPSGTRTIAKG